MSGDPSGTANGLNLYVYTKNAPIDHYDSSGLQAIPENKEQPVIMLAQREEAFSEFPRIETKPELEIEPKFDVEDSIPKNYKGQHQDAERVSKNVAVRRGSSGNDEYYIHANIEFSFRVRGKEVAMQERYVRVLDLVPADPKDDTKTVFNEGAWIVKWHGNEKFDSESPSKHDKPGFVLSPYLKEEKSVGMLQEFLVGSAKTGGSYFQQLTLVDPDLTYRVIVVNVGLLSPREFQAAKKLMRSTEFIARQHESFLFQKMKVDTGRTSSDSGVKRIEDK